jgi:hypothetical protein
MMSAEDEDEVKQASRWLRDMEIELRDEDGLEIIRVIKLDKLQRYLLIKMLWRSS